jgi:hypothetical protein
VRTDAPTARGLRDSPLGKAAILVAVLLAALLVARSCGSRESEISKEEAVEIARAEIDYEPDRVMTRFVPRGIDSRPSWAVSLSTVGEAGALDRITVVVVDGRTGQVVETRVQRG